ncbi:general odorant-binding protein 56h [Musca domestica]|uniref:General odorant-binding protein 56h n=1 Tax=Musca domestica TaxID=7370 RepID=A0A1I8NL52_MUSDO|nr:general odorant-binding protein 56h [Musca domestica]
MNLKYILIFSLFCGAAYIKADLDSLSLAMKDCLLKHSITQKEMDMFLENMYANVTENFKCSMKCVLEKEGIMKNGTFDDKTFEKKALSVSLLKGQEKQVIQAAEKCKNIKGSNDCDTAYKIVLCL